MQKKGQKRVKITISLIVFLILFLFLFGAFSEIFRAKVSGKTNMVKSFYDLEENTIDVLNLGSSHLYYGIQPNILWDEYGIAAYDLGSPQQNIPISYFLLKEALGYQKPKVVLLESYGFQYQGLMVSEERFRQVMDAMPITSLKLKKEMMDVFIPEVNGKDRLSYYIPFLLYHSRWQELEAEDFDENYFLRGSVVQFKTVEYEDFGLDIAEQKIPEVNLVYFEKILDLCEKNDIELVVFQTPYTENNEENYADYAKRQGVNLALEKYLAERGVPFVFSQKNGDTGIDFKTDFYNQSHLNHYGQEKMTRYMGGYLSENYDLPDRRGEDAYRYMESHYKRYKKYIEDKK